MMYLVPNPLIIPIGLIIGVLVAAPVGPVNVLCVQRAIERGFWGGIAAGLGAVLGDGLIAMFAALGVGAITGAIRHHRAAIQIVGGIALLAYGARLSFAQGRLSTIDPDAESQASLSDFVWDIPQTFFLTITNPGAVLGLFAIFGGVSTFVDVATYVDAFTMVAAIMAGSLGWWMLISNFISRIRHRITVQHLQRVNQAAGLVLVGFGAVLISEVIWKGGKLG